MGIVPLGGVQGSEDQEFEAAASSLMEQDYCILDGFLPEPSCELLLRSLRDKHQSGEFKKAGIGKGAEFHQNVGIRGDEIFWLEREGAASGVAAFMDKMEAMIAYFNRTCYTGIRDYEAHFAMYPPGAYYSRHLDQFRHNDNRRFTFILYLNFGWKPADGGTLKMFLPDRNGEEKVVEVDPIAGRLVCFRSAAIPHEVTMTHKTRYSVTGWWLSLEKGISFLR